MLKVVLDGGLCLPRNMSVTAPSSAPRPVIEYERLATNELLSGGLANRCTRERTVGSNPIPSATL